MIKFPYGISDFYQIITEDYFYVDRTDRILSVERIGKQLLFLRPRRFGKSLWLSTLENYYDVAKSDEFETLFGHLAIGQNPTPLVRPAAGKSCLSTDDDERVLRWVYLQSRQ